MQSVLRGIAASVVSVFAAGCVHHALRVEPYKPDANGAPARAIVYSLPKTVLQATVTVAHVEKAKQIAFEGVREVALATVHLPDRNAEFQIPLEGAGNSALLDLVMDFKFAETGFLTGSETTYADKTADVIKEVASLALSVGKIGFRAVGAAAAPEGAPADTTLVFFGDPADEKDFTARDGDLVWMLPPIDPDPAAPRVKIVLSQAAAWRRPSAPPVPESAEGGLYCRFPRRFFGKIVVGDETSATEKPLPPIAIAQLGTLARLPMLSKSMSSRKTKVEFHDATGAPKEYYVSAGGSQEAAASLAKSLESLAQALKGR